MLKREDGAALIIAVMCCFVAMTICLACLSLAAASRIPIGSSVRSIQAQYLAEAGVERAAAELANNNALTNLHIGPQSLNVNGRNVGTYEVFIERPEFHPCVAYVCSTGIVQGQRNRVTVVSKIQLKRIPGTSGNIPDTSAFRRAIFTEGEEGVELGGRATIKIGSWDIAHRDLPKIIESAGLIGTIQNNNTWINGNTASGAINILNNNGCLNYSLNSWVDSLSFSGWDFVFGIFGTFKEEVKDFLHDIVNATTPTNPSNVNQFDIPNWQMPTMQSLNQFTNFYDQFPINFPAGRRDGGFQDIEALQLPDIIDAGAGNFRLANDVTLAKAGAYFVPGNLTIANGVRLNARGSVIYVAGNLNISPNVTIFSDTNPDGVGDSCLYVTNDINIGAVGNNATINLNGTVFVYGNMNIESNSVLQGRLTNNVQGAINIGNGANISGNLAFFSDRRIVIQNGANVQGGVFYCISHDTMQDQPLDWTVTQADNIIGIVKLEMHLTSNAVAYRTSIFIDNGVAINGSVVGRFGARLGTLRNSVGFDATGPRFNYDLGICSSSAIELPGVNYNNAPRFVDWRYQ